MPESEPAAGRSLYASTSEVTQAGRQVHTHTNTHASSTQIVVNDLYAQLMHNYLLITYLICFCAYSHLNNHSNNIISEDACLNN